MVKIIDSRMLSGKKWIGEPSRVSHLFEQNYQSVCKSESLHSAVFSAAEQRFTNVCASCLSLASVDDFIIKHRIDTPPYRTFKFPTIKRCNRCGANVGLYLGNKEISSPDIANDIDLIMFVHNSMSAYDNPMPPRRKCECDIVIPKLKEVLNALVVEHDTGWIGAPGGRCITDFTRTITFANAPTQGQLEDIKRLFLLDNCPGWTGVTHRKCEKNKYQFFTTADSSG